MKKQVTIPSIGTSGTKGVLNALGASGILFRMTTTPIQTRINANRVPILVISPTTLAGTKAAKRLTNTRNSKLINVINEDSDQNSEHAIEISSVSKKDINPINSKHWKAPSKLYYQRPTVPDHPFNWPEYR